MTDAQLLKQFERGTLVPFHHAAHVHVAFAYLNKYPPAEALARFCSGLKHYAARHGKANLYHETVTWAYVCLIRQRMADAGPQTWEAFAHANPDLLLWKKGILQRYYRAETLESERAQKMFVFPDKHRVRTLPGPDS
ncbi:MAG TPA: hypothetical protein VEK33_01130 [Terriglobales bacterium]|nr:hypothetical protein [Terriglobales bacterium]